MSVGLTFKETDLVIQTLKAWAREHPEHADECDGACASTLEYLSSGQWEGYPYASLFLYDQSSDERHPTDHLPGMTPDRAVLFDAVGGKAQPFLDVAGELNDAEKRFIKEQFGITV